LLVPHNSSAVNPYNYVYWDKTALDVDGNSKIGINAQEHNVEIKKKKTTTKTNKIVRKLRI
jgi:hypothetical protein